MGMKKLLLMSAVLFFSLVCAVTPALAQDVNVGLYLLNLGKFDISSGQFTADFYLSFTCETNCSPENFEFLNGRATSIDKIIDEPTQKFYRIQALLSSPVDLKDFPFDKQKMQIIIEDKKNTIDKINYVKNDEETGMDDAVSFIGWNLDKWFASVNEHDYKVYDEQYSQFVYTIDVSRIALNSFFKTFVPVLIIVLIVMFSFIMDPDKITNRLTIATSSLVAAVMFHISISNQIPPVGYLTVADKFMLLTYLILLATVILNVVILEFIEQKKQGLAEKIHRITEYSVFIVIPIIYLIFFFVSI
jgi:hypothetical protein